MTASGPSAPAPAEPTGAGRRRIYLMRHGSVTYFDASGRPREPDGAPLNEKGRAEARAAGAMFAAAGVGFDRVIVSGLARTVETAGLVLAEMGARCPQESWPELAEIRGGPLARLRTEDLRDAFLGSLEGCPEPSTRFLGGETVGELVARVVPAIERLRAARDWETVLLVLHGGVNRVFLSYALTGEQRLLGGLQQAPACINALDVGSAPRDWVVRCVNVFAPDLLQHRARRTTMEELLEQYLVGRKT